VVDSTLRKKGGAVGAGCPGEGVVVRRLKGGGVVARRGDFVRSSAGGGGCGIECGLRRTVVVDLVNRVDFL